MSVAAWCCKRQKLLCVCIQITSLIAYSILKSLFESNLATCGTSFAATSLKTTDRQSHPAFHLPRQGRSSNLRRKRISPDWQCHHRNLAALALPVLAARVGLLMRYAKRQSEYERPFGADGASSDYPAYVDP